MEKLLKVASVALVERHHLRRAWYLPNAVPFPYLQNEVSASRHPSRRAKPHPSARRVRSRQPKSRNNRYTGQAAATADSAPRAVSEVCPAKRSGRPMHSIVASSVHEASGAEELSISLLSPAASLFRPQAPLPVPFIAKY
jgi:hypothetical protein